MPLTKEQKKKIIEGLKEKTGKQRIIIFADFTGLKVKDLSDLRKKLKKGGSELKVAKKTLLGFVFKNAGLEIDFKKLKGEIAAIFGYKNEISPAKTVYQLAAANANLKILGGIFGKNFVEAEKIIELAKLPTKEELLARLVGSVSAPISNFISVLQGNIKGLICILSAIKK
jgi:large subunit ribosomal protein L10